MKQWSDSWVAFLLWAVAGAGASLGILSMLTIGPFVLLGTLVVAGVLMWRPGPGAGMAGGIAGAAAPVLYVAWLNRDGPGTICTHSAGGTDCGDQWSPWPFLVVAVALLVAGVIVFRRLRRAV